MTEPAVAAYLERLELPAAPPPTLDTLRLLHRRHLDRVGYDNLAIMLGAPDPVQPQACLERLARTGRAGYCFHHNGALELVLRDLGFDVRRRHGHVWTREADPADPSLSHLVLEVAGLPSADNPGGRWWVDVGLGDAFLDPLPLVEGEHRQHPFRYRLADVTDHGWTFHHDARGSFAGVVVSGLPVGQGEVEAAHRRMSTPPDGQFTRVLVAQRRSADRILVLRGLLLTEIGADGAQELVADAYDAWRGVLAGPLAVPVDDLDESALRELHERTAVAHRAWDAAGRP